VLGEHAVKTGKRSKLLSRGHTLMLTEKRTADRPSSI
jgi:hypothetical protein